ncbi:unnamed protein product [Hymenolepis diminuta]|nr:unnamed protein product [Hymenolepis diminuta]VUZ47982.1 unnamed protein product [Hymenolepis diminuta]
MAICRHDHKFPAESKEGGSDGERYSISSTDSQDNPLSDTEEVIRQRMVRTINHAMIPKIETNELAKVRRRGVFTVGDPEFVRDIRIDHSWTTEL